MDNVTHSVIGFGVGELVHRSLPAEPAAPLQQTRHRLLLVACALASNFPDLDLFLTRSLPAPLGYLLNHRGHTHTVLWAVPQALLLAALLWLLWPAARRLLALSRAARWGLALSVGVGFALHLLMDYTNSYGVHPWYPLDARWLYGDMVFIIEPLFWVAIAVPMALIMRWPVLRLGGLAMLLLALAVCAARGYLGWISFAALLLIALACGVAQWRAGPLGRGGLLLALGISLAFIALQGAASQAGRAQIMAALRHADPAARVLDVAMTAFPSQPLCWTYDSIEINEAAGSYRLRRGVASIAPQWLAPAQCPAGLVEQAPLQALSTGVMQQGVVEASLAELRALKAGNCQADAWLRFGRMPELAAGALSDYRFAATPRGNFTTLPLNASTACPQNVPGWGYPRADLFGVRADS
ncbi:metal-dependent hydrolase [Duganella callida]|uniref:Metal-dependent hydrolase n=1 Tax=Duganella callida TaxID=2561932 RepID=A0A4Y9S7Z8_9BURK|nr:metal-dependent hydrolase [Duganella callida]TFW17662.1 metal-dependent hydrolase [Duganella callida]